MTTAVALRYRFYAARVAATRAVGDCLVRVTFGGDDLGEFAGGGRDQSVSVFLPHPGQDAPVVPVGAGEDWYGAWRALDPAVRAVMRSYTIRAQRPELGELDIDFVRHGDTGPATRWAGRARPGDRVLLLGPAVPDERTVRFQPPTGADSVLLVADETALPAVGGILDWLPAGTPVRAFVEVPTAGDIQPLPSDARAEVTWLVRGATTPGSLLADTLRGARLPGAAPYAWIAGEAGMVRSVRRHLVGERGLDRRRVTFAGYWRRGASEEDLRAEAAGA
ncbi:siderophore-interacting protein [Micromonospora sp. AMSO31t]|uniref:siderophore-interacting protein n=1 Tax=Micromonospora sp. AMSO31t TaxID=2650566 RepID=UPI00124B9C39|nr:siderophore-interacting protein [Micromonospora sp. AMSO31t]KAB1911552.1 siderophore-interacting protein [Micromonospora sp. AMSO31t]